MAGDADSVPAARDIVSGEDAGISISPSGGPVEGSTVLTFVSQGGGFDDRTSVLFGETAADSVVVVNEFVMTAISPAGDPGFVDIMLTVPGMAVFADNEINAGSFEYFILPPDDGTDSDGDGLTDAAELTGWEVWVDGFGLGLGVDTFGNVLRYTVISDPARSDTEGDGVDDRTEFLVKSDPRSADTDGDSLGDHEELNRWLTSATSIDTDADARGNRDLQNAPNPRLFDGGELMTEMVVGTAEHAFFSKYVEGSGFNRAVEIYNPTDHTIDLAAEGYLLLFVAPNGFLIGQEVIGEIPPLGTFLLADSRADEALQSQAAMTAELPIDGSHVVVLANNEAIADVIGDTRGPMSGPAALDQVSSAAVDGERDLAQIPWQSFTPGATGYVSRVKVRLRNTSAEEVASVSAEVRTGQGPNGFVLGTAGASVPPGNSQLIAFDFDSVDVTAGNVFTVVLRNDTPTAPVLASYSNADPYPGGRGDLAADMDYILRTWVSPYAGWGDDDVSTIDHTLRRQPRVCAGDPVFDDDFDPRGEWIALPIDTFDGLNSHNTNCPKFRVISGGTSPTLDDTDGDGRTDFEEFDDPLRTSHVANLPQIEFQLVDPVDVRLRVEYADSIGSEQVYGVEVSASEGSTTSKSDVTGTTESWQAGVESGFEGLSFTAKVSYTQGEETTESTEIGKETSREAASAFSQEQANSRERSIASSRGTVSVGMRAINTGNIAYTLNNLNITVRQFEPKLGQYRALTTLLPADVNDNIALAPGDASNVITLRDDDVEPNLVRSFLANPSSLLLDPSTYALLDAQGLDFVFSTEQTFGRTALVVIDYGDGAVVKRRIATNVDRLPDGAFAGIPMATVMQQLGLSYTSAADPGEPRRLRSIGTVAEELHVGPPPDLNDLPYPPGLEPGDRLYKRFWFVAAARGNQNLPELDLNVDFDELRLQARDEIRLVYARDEDRDGLNDRQEFTLGSSDSATKTDEDILSDWFEAKVGWMVTIGGANPPPPYQVFGNPTLTDSDDDSLADHVEYLLGTDPQNPDTDGDTDPDALDPFPVIPAATLHVNAAAPAGGDGASWATAFKFLTDAMAYANTVNADGDLANDVRQIWVAEGQYAYSADAATPAGVSLYGGFTGSETKRGQRNADPVTNNTQLVEEEPGAGILKVLSNGIVRLDGFTLAGAVETDAGGAMRTINANMVIANVMFSTNTTTALAAAMFQGGGNVVYENVIFMDNSASNKGGALNITYGSATLQNCQFVNNSVTVATSVPVGGGGAMFLDHSNVTLEGCTFRGNVVQNGQTTDYSLLRMGGGLMLFECDAVQIVGCTFRDNEVIPAPGDLYELWGRSGGGLAVYGTGTCSMVDSVVYGNRSPLMGGGVQVFGWDGSDYTGLEARFVNCSIVRNESYLSQDIIYVWGAGVSSHAGPNAVTLQNSIAWGNQGDAPLTAGKESEQITELFATLTTRNSCVQNLGVGGSSIGVGTGNTGADPFLANLNSGDLRLQLGSSCIDAGNRLVDIDAALPGTQPLRPTDIVGNPRVVDGDDDSSAEVDIGALEFGGAN